MTIRHYKEKTITVSNKILTWHLINFTNCTGPYALILKLKANVFSNILNILKTQHFHWAHLKTCGGVGEQVCIEVVGVGVEAGAVGVTALVISPTTFTSSSSVVWNDKTRYIFCLKENLTEKSCNKFY